jgi:hypothetical protein
MKILNKYRFARGAKSDPPTPRLVPPPNNQNLLKSISVSSSVDLLCEGPIYGLVDQFGKKVYGLDMLKGVYLNTVPVMNLKGEYNYRNVLMEINLGTENQKPLVNFDHVYIPKVANFKLIGAINPSEQDIRPNGSEFSNAGVEAKNFSAWARGSDGWPDVYQDPFVFIHHIRNKDVKKLKIGFVIEQLYDTISEGAGKGDAGSMGNFKKCSVEFLVKWGIEGSTMFSSRRVIVQGVVTSPYAYMIGDGASTLDSSAANSGSLGGLNQAFGSSIIRTSSIPANDNSRRIPAITDAPDLNRSNPTSRSI